MQPPLSARLVLENLTNAPPEDGVPIPEPDPISSKRPAPSDGDPVPKRVKFDTASRQQHADSATDSESDVEMQDVSALKSRARKRTVFALREAARMASSSSLMRYSICEHCRTIV